MSRLVNLTSLNMDALRVDSASYAQQFENAMNVNGGDIESASKLDYVMHFVTFGWKVRCSNLQPFTWTQTVLMPMSRSITAGLFVAVMLCQPARFCFHVFVQCTRSL